MTITDDEHKLAERDEKWRSKCPCFDHDGKGLLGCKPCGWGKVNNKWKFFHSNHCERCQGREYVPNITETALLDVLFKASRFLDICEFEVEPSWTVDGSLKGGDGTINGEGDTRHAALVAAVLGLEA